MWFRNLTFSILLLAGGMAGAAEDTGVARLQKFLNDTSSFEALFTQEVVSEKGDITQSATGRIQLARPGQFRWDYIKPASQEIVCDGKTVWFYDTELKQVTVKKLDEAIGNTPAAILTQGRDLTRDFSLSERPGREGLKWVELKPKKANTDFNRVLIGLDDTGIQGMDLYDQFGQITVIRFVDATNNPNIPLERFKFTPPEGVDVVGSPI